MTQLTKEHGAQFLRYVFGETPVGSAENESIDRDYSPELKAFLRGALGPVPRYWWSANHSADKEPTRNFTNFLREIADIIDGKE